MFILDAAYALLQNILQGNEARYVSFSVKYHSLMELFGLELRGWESISLSKGTKNSIGMYMRWFCPIACVSNDKNS